MGKTQKQPDSSRDSGGGYVDELYFGKFGVLLSVAAILLAVFGTQTNSPGWYLASLLLTLIGLIAILFKTVDTEPGYFFRLLRVPHNYVGFLGHPEKGFRVLPAIMFIDSTPYWNYNDSIELQFSEIQGLVGSGRGLDIDLGGYVLLQFIPTRISPTHRALFTTRLYVVKTIGTQEVFC